MAEHWARYAQSVSDADQRRLDEMSEWQLIRAPKLLANLQALCARVAQQEPITKEDVMEAIGNDPYGYTNRHLLTWPMGSSGTPAPYKPSENLVSLKNFLESIADEEVSTSALASAGWRNLRELLS